MVTDGEAVPELVAKDDVRQVTHALLREWIHRFTEINGPTWTDFHVRSTLPLGVQQKHRYRLFYDVVTREDANQLLVDAGSIDETGIAIAPFGSVIEPEEDSPVQIINPKKFDRLCRDSSVVVRSESNSWQVDRSAYLELKDDRSSDLAFSTGLLLLRPLSRNRLPQTLRWTRLQPNDLFERCFFLVATGTFGAAGARFGSKQRGKPGPDGVLQFPGDQRSTIYDCKASNEGYKFEYREAVAFADYLRTSQLPDGLPSLPCRSRFLVISSDFRFGAREASFDERRRLIRQQCPGSDLAVIRAPDLARFGLVLEQRGSEAVAWGKVDWTQLLGIGDIHWSHFDAELHRLGIESA